MSLQSSGKLKQGCILVFLGLREDLNEEKSESEIAISDKQNPDRGSDHVSLGYRSSTDPVDIS